MPFRRAVPEVPVHSSDRENRESGDSQHAAEARALAAAANFGCDKLWLRFPVDPASVDATSPEWRVHAKNLNSPKEFIFREATVDLGHGVSIFVRLREQPTWQATVQFNPARLLDPDGWRPAAIHAVPGAVAAVLAMLTARGLLTHRDCVTSDGVVQESPGLEVVDGIELQRADFAWDVRVEDTGRHLDHMRKRVGKVRSVPPNAKGNKGTVYFGAKDDRMAVYDKHRQSGGVAPAGTLRVEMQLRSLWLTRSAIRTVGDVTEQSAAAFFVQEFHRLGLDAKITDSGALERLLDTPGVSYTKLCAVLGDAMVEAAGLESRRTLSADTAREYRRIRASSGCSSPDALFKRGDGVTRYLDLEQNYEVVERGRAASRSSHSGPAVAPT